MAHDRSATAALSGPDKAAAFMLAVGETFGEEIWDHLSEGEARALTRAMSGLDSIDEDSIRAVFGEFVAEAASAGAIRGGRKAAERLSSQLCSQDNASNLKAAETEPDAGSSMWEQLGQVDEVALAEYLGREYPQTVAVVLQRIAPEQAARVLAALPDDFAQEVVTRMISLEAVRPEILSRLEETLQSELLSTLSLTAGENGHKAVADIFKHLGSDDEARFLEALENEDSSAAERIRDLMFTFEDLRAIEPVGLQTLMREVSKETLALALKGASEDMQELFYSNLSERAAAMLQEDMAAMGPVRLGDVEGAQKEIIAEAKNLAQSGEILITGTEQQDDLVY